MIRVLQWCYAELAICTPTLLTGFGGGDSITPSWQMRAMLSMLSMTRPAITLFWDAYMPATKQRRHSVFHPAQSHCNAASTAGGCRTLDTEHEVIIRGTCAAQKQDVAALELVQSHTRERCKPSSPFRPCKLLSQRLA